MFGVLNIIRRQRLVHEGECGAEGWQEKGGECRKLSVIFLLIWKKSLENVEIYLWYFD